MLRFRILRLLLVGATATASSGANASVEPVAGFPKPALTERLTQIRTRVIGLEQGLIDGFKTRKEAKVNLHRIQELMSLQQEEKTLGAQRMKELEKTIGELESRRGLLKEKVDTQRADVRKFLRDLDRTTREEPRSLEFTERDRLDSPRRRILASFVDLGLKEVETLKVDMADADQLEIKIQEEQQQLAYLFQDLREQEGILELNRQLQVDLLRKNQAERVAQLENYNKLKVAESQVENLIQNFNSRRELEKAVETERVASKAMMQGAFARLKGKLGLPAEGKIVSQFGPSYDVKSSLNVFKKGIDIDAGRKATVRAISAGKIAFSGELANYGRVTIIDHGEHFYSLCAHLGELHRQVGDPVAAGDSVGTSSEDGAPVYFEIRARNIAVNPLQWVTSASLGG